MAVVRWEDFEDNPAGFEKLAKLLLLREYPGAVSYDGRGGDTGIDVRWDSPDGLVVFECKKYTKITNPQKRHIRNSLLQAARHNPTRWILVAPTNPTPALHSWFTTELAGSVQFPLQWFGLDWLNERIAANPDIRRYSQDTAQAEVYNAFVQACAETAYLTRVSDLVTRAKALQGRADEMSPFWSFTWDPVTNAVNAIPKPGVTSTDLGIDFSLHFPDDEHAQTIKALYEETLTVGGTVTIPPEYVTNISIATLHDLGWPDGPGEMTFISGEHNDDLPTPITLRVTGGAERPTPPVHVTLNRRELGTHGMTLHGADATELLALRLVARHTPEGPVRFNLHLSLKDGTDPGVSVASCDPAAVLRLYEFFAGVDSDRIIEIGLPTTRISCPVPVAADPEFADLRDLLSDLVTVRDALGLNLSIPDVWTAQDQRVIRFAAQLLRGEHARFPWRIRPTSRRSAEEPLRGMRPASLCGVSLRTQIDNLPLTFNSQDFEVGPIWFHFDRVDLQDPEGCEAAARAGRDAEWVFVPQPGTRRLASMQPFPESPQT